MWNKSVQETLRLAKKVFVAIVMLTRDDATSTTSALSLADIPQNQQNLDLALSHQDVGSLVMDGTLPICEEVRLGF